MRILKGFKNITNIQSSLVSVGSFDGVHRGHRLLIESMNERADQRELEPVIVTFDPHPRLVLKGQNKLLSTLDEKLFLLEEAGARNVVVIDFDKAFSLMPYDTFVSDVLIDKLGTQAMFIGQGHHLGYSRQGNLEKLQKMGIEVFTLDRFENISSTAIRTLLEQGNLTGTVQMLGAPYLIMMPVTDPTKILPPNYSKTDRHIRFINTIPQQ